VGLLAVAALSAYAYVAACRSAKGRLGGSTHGPPTPNTTYGSSWAPSAPPQGPPPSYFLAAAQPFGDYAAQPGPPGYNAACAH